MKFLDLTKAALVAAAMLFGLVSQATALPRADLTAFTEQAIAASVRIGDAQRSFCSGTMVHSDRDEASGEVTTFILTAKHCTERVRQRLEVIVPVIVDNRVIEERHLMGEVYSRYASHDLALIRLLDEDTVFTTLAALADADVTLMEGEDTYTVGYARAMSRTITEGNFGYIEAAAIDDDPEREFYRATPAIVGGNSGGALFHRAEDGKFVMIGVTSGVWNGMWHMGYYVPISAIHAYVDAAIRLEASTRPTTEAATYKGE